MIVPPKMHVSSRPRFASKQEVFIDRSRSMGFFARKKPRHSGLSGFLYSDGSNACGALNALRGPCSFQTVYLRQYSPHCRAGFAAG